MTAKKRTRPMKRAKAKRLVLPPVTQTITCAEYERRLEAHLATIPAPLNRGMFYFMWWHSQQTGQFKQALRQQGIEVTKPATEADWLVELDDIARHEPERAIHCEAYHRLQRLNPALKGLSAEALAVVRAAEGAYYVRAGKVSSAIVRPVT
jgi:hypothetical protein